MPRGLFPEQDILRDFDSGSNEDDWLAPARPIFRKRAFSLNDAVPLVFPVTERKEKGWTQAKY